jgi:hypothetical protein
LKYLIYSSTRTSCFGDGSDWGNIFLWSHVKTGTKENEQNNVYFWAGFWLKERKLFLWLLKQKKPYHNFESLEKQNL